MPAPAPPVALEIAYQASRVRGGLLRAHRHHALFEDLEDIFSQALLELLLRAQRDPQLYDPAHISNALRQRFAARLADHHRALAGRSPATAVPAGAQRLNNPKAPTAADPVDLVELVLVRERTRELLAMIAALPLAQRLALLSDAGAIAPLPGAGGETHRKRCQRARHALRRRLEHAA